MNRHQYAKLNHQSEAWKLFKAKNLLDIELYNYAEKLYIQVRNLQYILTIYISLDITHTYCVNSKQVYIGMKKTWRKGSFLNSQRELRCLLSTKEMSLSLQYGTHKRWKHNLNNKLYYSRCATYIQESSSHAGSSRGSTNISLTAHHSGCVTA